MTVYTDMRSSVARAGPAARIASRCFALVRAWHVRQRQRREAVWFTARDLADIGLTREQLLAELSKPFWRR